MTTQPEENSNDKAFAAGVEKAQKDMNVKMECLRMASALPNNRNAGDLIKRAAGIHTWVTKGETPNE